MSDPDDLVALLTSFAPLLPLFVVWGGGVLVALLRWGRHPTVSLLTIIAMMLLFTTAIVSTLFTHWLTRARLEYGWSATTTATYYTILGVARALSASVSYALLLIAVFGWRWQMIRIPPDDNPPRLDEPTRTAIRPNPPHL